MSRRGSIPTNRGSNSNLSTSSQRSSTEMASSIRGIQFDLKINRGRNLVANDSGNLFSKKKSSDPYAIAYWGGEERARTKTLDKNLNPEWNGAFKIKAEPKQIQKLLSGDPKYNNMEIVVFDNDKLGRDDPMGTVTIPLNLTSNPTNIPQSWFKLTKGKTYVAKEFSGEIEIKLETIVDGGANTSTVVHKGEKTQTTRIVKESTIHVSQQKIQTTQVAKQLVTIPQNMPLATALPQHSMSSTDTVLNQIQHNSMNGSSFNDINIEIEIKQGRNLIAKDSSGLLRKKKTSDPYAVIYWGGEKEGDTKTIDNDLNPKWNETFKFKVGSKRMPQLLRRDSKYKTIDIVIFDKDKLSKDESLGSISIPTNNFVDYGMSQTIAAKWYSLEKGKGPYPAKEVSGEVEIGYKVIVERVETNVAQIERPIKVGEHHCKSTLKFKLRWSTSAGNDKKALDILKDKMEKVDPHASAICFDEALNLVDIASFKDKETNDKAIIHCGKGENNFSEKNGEGVGGESLQIKLDKIHPKTAFICIIINSFKGRKMKKVLTKYGMDLIDESGEKEMANNNFSNPKLMVHSALMMGCLYRDPYTKSWMMQTIVQAALGIVTNQVVDVLQNVIHYNIPGSCSQQVPVKHSSGPRAALVVEC